MGNKMFNITVTHNVNITQEDIDDIMCVALEGGITYWCHKAKVVSDYLGEYASEQISRGGALKLYDRESGEVYELTLEKLLNGIKLAIQNNYYAGYGWYYGNQLDTCQVDAIVADVIVQLALFNEIIYG